jgi:hypothetical protein
MHDAHRGTEPHRSFASTALAAIRDARVQKASRILLIVILAMQLGRYTVYFSGTPTAWTALAVNAAGLLVMLLIVLREIWKPNSPPPSSSSSAHIR